MIQALQVIALLLVAAAWAFAFAHAAEYPGKMRLDRDAYLATQTIYYPGFTIGGASEPLAALALIALLAFTPLTSTGVWLIVGALVATALTQVVFWAVTQPVNRIWLKNYELGKAGKTFFGTDAQAPEADWTKLRDRWERSHILRALLMTLALVALAVALVFPA